jgi:coenzyme PQQ precursor peptide PqqA
MLSVAEFKRELGDGCLGRMKMAWKSPKIVEIALGCEINCYACAELKS